MATEEQPQVTVRGIPQNQYNSNVAASTQDPADAGPQEGGIKGHLKKNWPIYTVVLAIVTILVMVWLNRSNSNSSSTGYDTTGYGTGNSNASDLYGSQLDADYQQMINESNITNSLLQQLLNGSGNKSTTGGSSGSGSSSGSSGGHKKKPPKNGGKSGSGGKTKGGGNTGGSSGGYHGSTGGGHNKSGSTSSSHSVGTSHSNGKTTIKPNPHYGGAHGYVYTTKGTETATQLQAKFFPTSNGSNKQGNFFQYGNNQKLIKSYLKSGQAYWTRAGSGRQLAFKPGTRLNA